MLSPCLLGLIFHGRLGSLPLFFMESPSFSSLRNYIVATNVYPYMQTQLQKFWFENRLYRVRARIYVPIFHTFSSNLILFFLFSTVESACGVTSKEGNISWNLFSIQFLSGGMPYIPGGVISLLLSSLCYSAGPSLPPFLKSHLLNMKSYIQCLMYYSRENL